MNCPFCDLMMNKSVVEFGFIAQNEINFNCYNSKCMVYKMSRYHTIFTSVPDGEMLLENFIMDNFFVWIDKRDNFTEISRLDVIILKDTVVIPKVLDFNLKNTKETLDKLKFWVMFS